MILPSITFSVYNVLLFDICLMILDRALSQEQHFTHLITYFLLFFVTCIGTQFKFDLICICIIKLIILNWKPQETSDIERGYFFHIQSPTSD